ncbi:MULTISPECIES: ABC transporter substrate-binding protein [unclassified Bradyrhizobium]|uniref:ABC transporter substrate-binding protein n=1 Tax=unclassified Bradyrhizobium TaxID=2631580 RepID=UPI002479847A|nr:MULTISPECIES: ABC transporter substrate-binding protein [unclassified Bradyrhizobium]WGR75080.1 ABC transporter substrate-binding protein [Bradyrhizobium sp. ISRA426]WGR82980.1 ABC transporter substrate-binding protein [Bradyrhizobium sp. ISRA430]WGR90280.1 ABC transporter substrate-binding protein [Bradyrhizobium sp. ISRA432]
MNPAKSLACVKATRLCYIALLSSLLLQSFSADAAVKIGVLNDQSGPYSEVSGAGSVDAARMAIEDFGGSVLGQPIELIVGDHQNRADIGLGIAKRWFDVDGVNTVVDIPNSSVALAIQSLARERKKIVLYSSAGASELTGKACSPYGIHWTYDTFAITAAPVRAAIQSGLKSWYFITVDFAFGHALQRDATRTIDLAGGKVLGATRHPFNLSDFASALLAAQASKADIIALANAGADTSNALKQAAEFGLPKAGQKVAALGLTINEVHALGLEVTQGTLLTESFYWNLDDQSRAWSDRFMQRNKKMPTMLQAGVYGAVTHYLKAVANADTTESDAVLAAMRKLPINDMMTKDGRIREDGRVLRDFHVFQVKAPSESKGPWDYYKLLKTIPADEATIPLRESQCETIKR